MAQGMLVLNGEAITQVEAASELELQYCKQEADGPWVAFVPCDTSVVQVGWLWDQNTNTWAAPSG